MARTDIIVRPPAPAPLIVEQVILTMTPVETQALITVLRAVGGSPRESGSMHIDGILSALGTFPYRAHSDAFQEKTNSLYWKDGTHIVP